MSTPVDKYDLQSMQDNDLILLSKKLNLGLSLYEMKLIKSYYEKRNVSAADIELEAIAQQWSEHCSYKSSKLHLKKAIFPVNYKNVVYRGDAGVVKFDKEHCYAIRMESHNHPSNVEPYGGAATGIGGIIRDVLAVGAKPVGLVDPLFFGNIHGSGNIPEGVRNPRFLFSGVVAGIRDYGNRVGVPTVSGFIVFDDKYLTNSLINVGCIGFMKRDELIENHGHAGELVLLSGGLTGRDGIHGVSFASEALNEDSGRESRSAVQVGDPITKEPLIRSIRECIQKRLISGMKDLGGGGLSASSSEFALSGKCGIDIDLDRVPLKDINMKPWEIFISESQERMLFSIKKSDIDDVMDVMNKYDVKTTVIGSLNDSMHSVVRYNGDVVFDLDLPFLVEAPLYDREFIKRTHHYKEDNAVDTVVKDSKKIEDLIRKIISYPDVASKEHVIRQYDHEVQGKTIVKPLTGYPGHEAAQDSSVIKPLWDSWKGLAITTASAHRISSIDPYLGGAYTVIEAVTNLVSVGATPDSLSNCLNFGNPEKKNVMGDFIDTVNGISYASKIFKLSIPSGNVSFYNEFNGIDIPATPVVTGVGLIKDVRKVITTCLKEAENPVYIVGAASDGFAGSIIIRVAGNDSTLVPKVNIKNIKRYAKRLLKAMRLGYIKSAHDISDGGGIVSIIEAAIGGQKGLSMNIEDIGTDLFSESPGRWIVEVDHEYEQEFRELLGTDAHPIGITTTEKTIVINNLNIKMDLDELESLWKNSLL
ncbi:MAG: phosphoribosylformylglycinamidine synthase subunit PurL [Candidatus Thermoplasmatota archaeon]|nr:phosphoribosylformylglycinamidine synthase subunit PurL [Candidatus Thermoplasmatota archaeon]MCL5964117.1 phosphoribosylformylglycinamidine synthase subunit PurL [Candidatus Thermoplasmatota archaeon]